MCCIFFVGFFFLVDEKEEKAEWCWNFPSLFLSSSDSAWFSLKSTFQQKNAHASIFFKEKECPICLHDYTCMWVRSSRTEHAKALAERNCPFLAPRPPIFFFWKISIFQNKLITVRRVIFVLQSLQFFLMVGIRGLDFLYLLLHPVCFTITCLGKTLVYIHERMKVKKANNVLVWLWK